MSETDPTPTLADSLIHITNTYGDAAYAIRETHSDHAELGRRVAHGLRLLQELQGVFSSTAPDIPNLQSVMGTVGQAVTGAGTELNSVLGGSFHPEAEQAQRAAARASLLIHEGGTMQYGLATAGEGNGEVTEALTLLHNGLQKMRTGLDLSQNAETGLTGDHTGEGLLDKVTGHIGAYGVNCGLHITR